MGLGILILGLAVFLATHVFVSFREARASVIGRVGLPLYRGLFAIVTLVGLALIIWGYAQYRAHDWAGAQPGCSAPPAYENREIRQSG